MFLYTTNKAKLSSSNCINDSRAGKKRWATYVHIFLFIPRHYLVAGYIGFTLNVRVSVRRSVSRPSVRFSYPDDNLSKHQWISIKFGMCINIVEICLGLQMCKLRQILRELSARETPLFSFQDDNSSKRQWIFTKLCMCIDIVEIKIGIANGKKLSNFDGVICPIQAHIFVSGR